MDKYDRALLAALLENGRLSFAELARRINLSPPAVADRVARLEADGVITGYHASVDLTKMGRSIQCLIEMRLNDHRSSSMLDPLLEIPQIIDCYRITGESCVMLKVAVSCTRELEELIDRLAQFGTSRTSLILSTPFAQRIHPGMLQGG
ncbi:Lrp/AsnC family transcriptional regulator [Pseudomonas sp. ZM23]|uniref:Lrp/AsnC family transcriptional regulator n=1 Tax=Pseudomonas triclosanedens TaxID=2961893 RepID=A0ABY6ZVD3_9PSED|nr:Lrp/AsnC family transcriptional regulator [Pseudomonas triclosanedens]MCP8465344.1 Lrp/AsnC family transcriptional regulator [Pseudomonas triclosanedens]MCP8470716.1 Lrp/AsnC family transcriptional regulator [Pseudomonas triclosanedens]MCP8476643.1 Lrp/AsnC family transcriptional regulator [Pseudomonas triclosanedens]WAI48902.1 Lrp/AsnC family transcriptional regulator [Pseudomonas triclosanedens]